MPRILIVITAACIVAASAAAFTRAATSGRSTASATVACEPNVPLSTFVPVTGSPLGDIKIDDACQYVYAANPALNRIEVYSLQSKTLLAPIAVGSAPQGFDITPDGATMYVANSGGNNISVVDLQTKQELRKISVAPNNSNDKPFSLAIANNGRGFLSTTFAGSGFGARMLQIDLATDAIIARNDFYLNGSTTEATFLRASSDRTKIGVIAGDISSGPVFTYTSATDTFSPEKDMAAFVSYIAPDTTGSRFLVQSYPNTLFLDAALLVLGSIPLPAGAQGFGVAVGPSGTAGYRATAAGIDVLNLSSFVVTRTIAPGDTIGGPHPASHPARMAISSDGSLLAVTTDHGFALINPNANPPTPTPIPSTATPTYTNTPSAEGTETPAARPSPRTTATRRPAATATPGSGDYTIDARTRPIVGSFGSIELPRSYTRSVSVRFLQPRASSDYVIMLTPVNRDCAPKIISKTLAGFVFECAGVGGSMDWAIIASLGDPRGEG